MIKWDDSCVDAWCSFLAVVAGLTMPNLMLHVGSVRNFHLVSPEAGLPVTAGMVNLWTEISRGLEKVVDVGNSPKEV